MKNICLFTVITAITFILTACSTIQEIQIIQTGEHSYEIITQDTSYPGPEILQRKVIREARKFCHTLSKKLHIIAVHETKPPFVGSKIPRAEVQFKCLAKGH